MFDNLREEATSGELFQEEAKFQPAKGTQAPRKPGKFLGMTPVQRFILAFMLTVAVCALGLMFLLITGKMALF